MKAYVISLKGSERRKIAFDRALMLGLDPVFFDAIDGLTDSSIESLLKNNNEDFQKRYKVKRNFLNRELATLLSHQEVYKTIKDAENDAEPYLILEDDFVPSIDNEELKLITNYFTKNKLELLVMGYSRVDQEEETLINFTNPLVNIEKIPSSNRIVGNRILQTTR